MQFGINKKGTDETHYRPWDASAEVHEYPGETTKTGFTEYDGEHAWNGSETNSFLVGMESNHDSGYEDREYKYYYTNSENWVLSNCKWKSANVENKYDKDVKIGPLLSHEVIAGNRWIDS